MQSKRKGKSKRSNPGINDRKQPQLPTAAQKAYFYKIAFKKTHVFIKSWKPAETKDEERKQILRDLSILYTFAVSFVDTWSLRRHE